ncbi:fungal hydrophobin [Lentinus tigrinus ALCF2SS1-7]|uniref:Hydrophobin n=1 Tax=Lentinus tigrinus ALCF2SS1-6 TaxID=1328759 RepID=A0A5C2SNU4_9APHY|nr:fungal hydrophobin [Lentinus tigrinus ALCF2SS1-6]RPD79076.1 fungal hydrophobin [Lentinus tigrinus ALCF2SS1-7]
MFSRAIAIFYFTLTLSVLAAATPADLGIGGMSYPATTSTVTAPGSGATPIPSSKCSTGNLQCCNQTQKANNPATSLLLALLGIVVQGVDALVGLDCNPITVIGVASANQCNAQAICCPVNNTGGLISVGCIPVTL